MATLEKIRSKSVLLFIIIIVALLAFILGDFLTSGQTYFGTGTTVAKAAGAKVDYTDYSNRINAVSEQNRNGQQTPDNDILGQQVINQILLEKLLEKEYEDLGIVVTNQELTAALTGENIHPAAMQFIYTVSQQIGLPTPSGAEVYQAMMNPAKYGLPAEAGTQLKQMWANLEDQVEESIKGQKFGELMLGLYTANELDAKSFYDDVANTRHITYAAKALATVTNEEAEITDDDRRAAWEEHKAQYRLTEPVRAFDYIMVRIEPSQADRLAGQQAVENALLALNSQEGTEAVAADSKFIVNRASTPKSKITDRSVVAFLDSASVGKAAITRNVGDSYTIAKLLGISNDIDSINVSMLGRADSGSLDSIKAVWESGVKLDSILADETFAGQDSIWASLLATGIDAKVKDALTNNAIGVPFILTDTVQGQAVSTLYRINRRHAPVAVYDVALIEYTVDPSQETLTQLSADLNTFVSNNSSAADFAANAAEAGYTLLSGAATASSPHLANVPDSRPALKWVMEAKKGQVMPIYQDNKQTYLLTAAVKDIYKGDYLPFDSDLIATDIDAYARANKKAAILAERYNGKAKDVAGIAKLMEVEATDADIIFSAPMFGTLGMNESALQGAAAAAEAGKMVGPVKGNNHLVYFVVNGQDASGREYTFTEYANQFNRFAAIGNFNPAFNTQNQASANYMVQLLLGKEKIENNSLKFIQGIGD